MSQTRQLLIVDDDTDLRQALVEQLAMHPEFQVQAVETAGAALETVATTTPDLIIMDVGLPDLDGREAVKLDAPGWVSSTRHHADSARFGRRRRLRA
jgi:CheY-like chemotaxis protein